MAAPPPYDGQQYPPQGQHPPPGQQYPPQGQYPPPGQYPPQGQYPPPGSENKQYPPPAQGGYPQQPAQGGYPQQQMQAHHTTTVISTQPAVVSAIGVAFREFPVSLTCPSCRAQVISTINYDVGTMAWLLCLIMFLVGLWPCCFIPFCIDGCKDGIHSCPNCSVTLGVFRRM